MAPVPPLHSVPVPHIPSPMSGRSLLVSSGKTQFSRESEVGLVTSSSAMSGAQFNISQSAVAAPHQGRIAVCQSAVAPHLSALQPMASLPQSLVPVAPQLQVQSSSSQQGAIPIDAPLPVSNSGLPTSLLECSSGVTTSAHPVNQTRKEVPILPKPHTLLLPLEYEIHEGRRFVIKTGPTVAICDPFPPVPRFEPEPPRALRTLKPKVSTVCSAKHVAAIGSQVLQLKTTDEDKEPAHLRTHSINVDVQTGSGKKSRGTKARTKIVMETETQTSGEYILRKPRKRTNVSLRTQSCGTHTATDGFNFAQSGTQTIDEPIPHRRAPTKRRSESSQTTGEPFPKRQKTRKTKSVAWQTEPEEIPLPGNQVVQSIQTVHSGELVGTLLSVRQVNQASTSSVQTHLDCCINTDQLQLSSIETQTLQSQELSHNATQTQALWEELEQTLAESISTQTFPDLLGETTSTQTFDSFLSSAREFGAGNSRLNSSTRVRSETSAQNTGYPTGVGQDLQDPIIGGSEIPIGHSGAQTDESSLSNFLSSSAQTSLFDDTTAFTSIETQTMDDMFEQFLSNMHTQTMDFFNNLELSDIQTQTQEVPLDFLPGDSFETSTQTPVAMATGSSHAEAQTSVSMDTSNFFLDTETQTLVTFDATENASSESATQTLLPMTTGNTLATAETQTHAQNTQSVGTSSLVELTESETQTLLLETLGLNDVPIHSETQTSWDPGSYL